ncbi:OBAP family protein [Nitrosococcus oceani]|uniref:OBAP family protein n=1 Tax=Nitrosococcus oceani TaxID=1229 RepID=UPI0004E96B04|nr:OBAP family protein [Nitrosococcus oceani]KFI21564.1 hypothetical protein HW44_15100 [Nitrosococcus oceani]
MVNIIFMAALLVIVLATGCTGSGKVLPALEIEGQPESIKTNVLETGALALQRDAPPDKLNIYLVGFHPLKNDPQRQFEAHHFCQQVNQDFAQCVLYDGNTPDANMNGIEYIISERLFNSLPEKEQQYWHPHNGEILSGQLVAPGLPEAADKEVMQGKMNSYGKTWHTWRVTHGNGNNDQLPLGEPALAWSFNRFGEAKPGLVESRDRRMDINTEERRRQRQDLTPLAHPQAGVDALQGKFKRSTQPIPGVVDKSAAPGLGGESFPSQ